MTASYRVQHFLYQEIRKFEKELIYNFTPADDVQLSARVYRFDEQRYTMFNHVHVSLNNKEHGTFAYCTKIFKIFVRGINYVHFQNIVNIHVIKNNKLK